MRLRPLLVFGVPALAIASFATHRSAHGDSPADPEARARCASRLSIALTGQAPSDALLASTDPQGEVDTLLSDPAFVEQFSRFVNANMNPEPGMTAADDSAYYMSRYVLENHRPWHEMFDGQYRIDPVAGTPPSAQVVADTGGLGYFRSRNWMVRYAGNEQDGYRLSAAFRIQQNIIGLDVSAVTNAPGTNVSASGRMAPQCSGCHYDPYFALDKVAKILSRRVGTGDTMTFSPPTEGPQQILDGHTINNDSELIAALVQSTDAKFRVCRLAFQYLYGRAEATCEAPLFDACVDAFESSGDIRAALHTIAADKTFCE